MVVAGNLEPDGLNPSLYPLGWPPLPVLPAIAILLAATAGFAAPPVRQPAAGRPVPARARVAA